MLLPAYVAFRAIVMNVEQHETLSVAGYELRRTLRRGRKTIIYRGLRTSDRKEVILKCLHEEMPSARDIARLRREFEILSRFDDRKTIKAYALEPCGNGYALVLEDFGGQSLRQLMDDGSIPLKIILRVAIAICESIALVHAGGVIHKDVKPDNVIIDLSRENWRVALADFSISSTLHEENQAISNPDVLEGTLYYMSPEQTGRMNRKLDYRTDYYSFGVMLYELVTGRLPFEVSDPMELVHCHIARKPPPLRTANEEVPKALAAIILKLMAKTAEERYQSAVGIRADLQRCLTQLESSGQIGDFTPGQDDVSERFHIPEVLYGREEVVDALLASFTRVCSGGKELVLVSGPSGVGKSAVIREIHKPIVGRRGHFITGKFDQFSRDVPYSSLIQAFQELIRQLLTESDEVIELWRGHLMDVLGANASVVSDVIPELVHIIGEPPPAAELPAPEAANRFRSTFRNFVRAFASEEHPLVIFLDDLQWTDPASLNLIELLLTDGQTNYVLWIGAYREAELGPDHMLHVTLRNLREAEVNLEGIGIEPLGPEHTTALVVDTLRPAIADVKRLAELIQAKTEGNPFFVRVLLRSLNEQGLLRFDSARGGWDWDIAKVEEAKLDDDVVDLMASKIERLSPKTRESLKYAACIGNRFDLKLLATVAERTPIAVAEDLWEAVERGIVRPIGDGYKYLSRTADASDVSVLTLNDDVDVSYQFVHDKVQLAAYSVLGESQRREVHLRIGRLLLRSRTSDEIRESVFSVINHLNTGIVLIDDPAERQHLAELNLIAGRRATQSIAYDSACNYLRQGLALLPAHAWSSCYEVNFQLNRELMKAEYLAGNVNAALELYQPLLDHARTTLEKGDVYVAKVELDASLKHNEDAVKTAQDGLKSLGMSVPSSATVPAILAELARFEWKLRKLRPSDIPRLPELKDPKTRLGLTLMISAVPAAYFVDTRFAAVLMLRIANITLSEGLTDVSPFGFAGYGLVLSGQLNSHEKAYAFAELAHTLNDRFRNPWLDTKLAFMTALFIRVWVRPFEEVRRQLDEAYHTGLQKGDLNYALYSGVKAVTISLLEGLNLSRVIDLTTTLLPPVSKMGEHDGEGMLTVLRRTCMCLRGDFPEPPSFDDEGWNEREFATYLADESVPTPQAYFYYSLFKSMVLYLFGDHDEAARHLAVAEGRLESMMAQPVLADFHFYQCLNAAALYGEIPRDRKRHDKTLKTSLRRLEKWSKLCPQNFEPRYLLAAAEKARIEGRVGETVVLYNRAIESSRRYGALHCEAIAFERAARFCLATGQVVIGENYLRESRSAYRRWGAAAKANLLAAEFPDVLPDESLTGELRLDTDALSPRITQASSAKVLDIDTVIRASQAISSEIQLERLLRELLRVVIVNAGAEVGFLILIDEGRLIIEAEGGVDPEKIKVLQSEPVAACPRLSTSIVKFVARTGEDVLLDDAVHTGSFTKDPYVISRGLQSILCTPIIHKGKISGVLYLENNHTTSAFTVDRLDLLKQLAAQIAISVENARLYENLQQALEDTLKADRAKTQFLMNMSHELRTPLNAVIGYTELIEEEAEDGDIEEFISDLGKIRVSAKRLLRTLTSILELSRLQVGDSKPNIVDVSVDETMRRVLDEIGEAATDNNNNLKVENATDVDRIRSDPWMLYYCLMSVLDNACRFTKNGLINVKISSYERGGATWIRFCIRDTGIGISEQDLAGLFDAFDQVDYSTTRTYEGSGVSLAVVQRFAIMLGGRVEVESTLGEGSAFTIVTPADSV